MRALKLFLIATVLCLWSTPTVQAQEGGEKLKLGAAMLIDFGGSVVREASEGPDALSSSARVTPGLRLSADYDVHRHIGVGGMLRLGFWRSEEQDSARNMLVDVLARVNGHYDWHDFRFYGVFMIGPPFDRLRAENRGGVDNPGAGVALGISPGVEWWFSRRWAAFTEILGYSGHYFRHDYVGNAGEVNFRIHQVLWQFGVLLGL